MVLGMDSGGGLPGGHSFSSCSERSQECTSVRLFFIPCPDHLVSPFNLEIHVLSFRENFLYYFFGNFNPPFLLWTLFGTPIRQILDFLNVSLFFFLNLFEFLFSFLRDFLEFIVPYRSHIYFGCLIFFIF